MKLKNINNLKLLKYIPFINVLVTLATLVLVLINDLYMGVAVLIIIVYNIITVSILKKNEYSYRLNEFKNSTIITVIVGCIFGALLAFSSILDLNARVLFVAFITNAFIYLVQYVSIN